MQAIRQIDFTIMSLSLELKVLHLAPHNIDVFSSLKKQQPRNVGFSLSYCYSMMLIRFPMHFHDVLKTFHRGYTTFNSYHFDSLCWK